MMNLPALPISEGVRRRLEASLQRLSHAYIISGPSESTNKTLARWLAAAYVCSGADAPCGVCANCKKARGEIHPDIISLEAPEDKQNITVEQVRQLRAAAYIRPNEANRKVFIINGDQLALRHEGQNALLKVLEDGPEYLAFLIVTGQPEKLLTTIRSRCETLSLIPRGEEELQLTEEIQESAGKLARLLLSGSERELVEYTVEIENMKWKKEDMTAFFSAAEDALRPYLQTDPGRAIHLLDLLKEVRAASSFHVGAGHLLGWLAAGR